MASRRSPDLPQSSRPALPPAAPDIAKPARKSRVTPVKRSADPAAAGAKTVRKKKPATGVIAAGRVSADERRGMIAKAAYLRGERRGFPPGGEAEDWLAAEMEIDALLNGGAGPAQ